MRKVLALLAVTAGLAACSQPQGSAPAALSPSAKPAFHYAMTGLPAPPNTQPGAVIAVKVDNTTAGQPQQGVRQADLVVEEPVEGGLTRLAAFFESKSPTTVGPVRSVRTSDIGLVQPVSATLVGSGGDAVVLAELQRASVDVVTEGQPGFTRSPDRVAPYNLYVDLPNLRQAHPGEAPQQPYLQFGAFDFPPGEQAKQVDITFSPTVSGQWQYDPDSGDWQRMGSLGPYQAKTLVILEVKLVDTGELDSAHNPVPEAVTTGGGGGYIVTGRFARAIRWSKDSAHDPFDLVTQSGLVISAPPGHTWIALIPKGTGQVAVH